MPIDTTGHLDLEDLKATVLANLSSYSQDPEPFHRWEEERNQSARPFEMDTPVPKPPPLNEDGSEKEEEVDETFQESADAWLVVPDSVLSLLAADVLEDAGGPGFTGVITDKLGRKVHFVNGKRVKGGEKTMASGRQVHAKFNGEDVHIEGHDPATGLAKLSTPSGMKVVHTDDLDFGPDEPSAKPSKKFGKSKAQVEVRMGEEIVEQRLAEVFPGVPPEQARQIVADIVGAPDDAQVFLLPDRATGLAVSIKHKDIKRCDRSIVVDEDTGEKYIHNDYLEVKTQGSGLGTAIFARQVENAAANGFAYIETVAGGSHNNLDASGKFKAGGMGGYYFWPKIGYDQDISKANFSDELEAAIHENFPEAKSMRDVMNAPGGMEWWKKNGEEIDGMRFDLSEGSLSRKMLDRYVARESQRKNLLRESAENEARKTMTPQNEDNRRGDQPDFSDEEDASLTQAFQEVMQGKSKEATQENDDA